MKFIYTFIGIFIFLSCSEVSKTKYEKSVNLDYDNSKVNVFLDVVNNLNQKGYVPYYRQYKETDFDFEFWHINSNDSTFVSDSIFYSESREAFFNQNREFLHWLVSFKNDTTLDSNKLHNSLWKPFKSPYSSYISQCDMRTSKSNEALNLIYGFLNGKNIQCVECSSQERDCRFSKYESVELFLNAYPTMNVEELRNLWSPKKYGLLTCAKNHSRPSGRQRFLALSVSSNENEDNHNLNNTFKLWK
jgi:hypothetical protein